MSFEVTSKYESNVEKLTRDLERKLERIVARAARDGAGFVDGHSDPPLDSHATGGETNRGVASARVFVSPGEWWAGIFDKGSLGKRKVPLEQPGRRKSQWKVRRRGKLYPAYRSIEALTRGGIEPQYFLIKGKRHAEQRLAEYLKDGL